ncbi:MAG: FkbM family methyltransferase [Candidatus Marinimicrobia bacterium]|nr:FkbM family methyltransferase [Candidatus Neomarinimicrobiota bacterium]
MKFTKIIQRISSLLRLIKTHPLTKGEKLSAFIRYFTFHFIYEDGEEIAIPFSKGHLIISKGEGSQAHYFTFLEDYEEMVFLLHCLRSKDQFIDVGANIGAYSILVASQIGCKTIAFEPLEKNYNILQANLHLNNLQELIELHNFALGEKNEIKTIGTKGALTYITNNQALELQKVEIHRLDDFVKCAQIIKIDVEGFEEFVLRGATQVLNHPDTNAVILELAGYNRFNSSNAIIHEFMIKNQYFPVQYFPDTREIKKLESFRTDQFNTIYIKNMKLVKKRIIDSPQYKIGSHWV